MPSALLWGEAAGAIRVRPRAAKPRMAASAAWNTVGFYPNRDKVAGCDDLARLARPAHPSWPVRLHPQPRNLGQKNSSSVATHAFVTYKRVGRCDYEATQAAVIKTVRQEVV